MFALVLELVPSELAAHVTRRFSIPVIGIGAGADCDGQVQVWHDMLGLNDGKTPRHAKRFAEIGAQMGMPFAYAEAVRARQFPTAAQSPSMKRDVLAEIVLAQD